MSGLRVLVGGKLLRGDIKGRVFFLNWPHRILAKGSWQIHTSKMEEEELEQLLSIGGILCKLTQQDSCAAGLGRLMPALVKTKALSFLCKVWSRRESVS